MPGTFLLEPQLELQRNLGDTRIVLGQALALSQPCSASDFSSTASQELSLLFIIMAPLILHNVPDDELYVGDDGIKRPYAMIFNQYVLTQLHRASEDLHLEMY